jgi:hypothetical protein
MVSLSSSIANGSEDAEDLGSMTGALFQHLPEVVFVIGQREPHGRLTRGQSQPNILPASPLGLQQGTVVVDPPRVLSP